MVRPRPPVAGPGGGSMELQSLGIPPLRETGTEIETGAQDIRQAAIFYHQGVR